MNGSDAPDLRSREKSAVRASSTDRPVYAPLQTSCVAAVNRRSRPIAAFCIPRFICNNRKCRFTVRAARRDVPKSLSIPHSRAEGG
jgi:hypothetical protein